MNRYWLLIGIMALPVIPAAAAGPHDFHFPRLADRWDEAVPLGNGMLGALIWQEGSILRFSLDRADLWDNRPVENFQKPEFTFAWMYQKILEKDIQSVQDLIDKPYDRDPAPTRIPAGRLELDQAAFGPVQAVTLDIQQALGTVQWESGVQLQAFVHADRPVGWFRLQGCDKSVVPRLIPPPFSGDEASGNQQANSLSGHTLQSLGYPAPEVINGKDSLTYRQKGWGGFEFVIHCAWRQTDAKTFDGAWAIVSNAREKNPAAVAEREVTRALRRTFSDDLASHARWWKKFWEQSAIAIPDPLLETQWYREMYKFGSTARRGAPPISLQAVWTADERRIPPWKGDYHHDLNTELSYWPCYSANHLEEGLSFLDWLWEIQPAAKNWTRRFYNQGGLNVPGVTTIQGEPMGGWHQYTCSPTTSAWLAHHFYLHWCYSQDRNFLKTRAYPWIRDVAVFLLEHSRLSENGVRQLPLSSSPEINDNRLEAWFQTTTNYDLALIRWVIGAAAELAEELGEKADAMTWRTMLDEWPPLARDETDGRLLVAPNCPLRESHRHFSHLMAIFPLGLIDPDNGEEDQKTIASSLAELERLGPDWWCGYSYAWLGSLYARACQGDKAAEVLRIFAECFCSPNSFHLNGDQTQSGKSKMTYRPFTLEGNMAFAAGVQEMLLKSHRGIVRVFPAIPESWREAAFTTLRAEGAFLVSARRAEGKTQEVRVVSEAGKPLRLVNPFGEDEYTLDGISEDDVKRSDGQLIIPAKKGMTIILRRK